MESLHHIAVFAVASRTLYHRNVWMCGIHTDGDACVFKVKKQWMLHGGMLHSSQNRMLHLACKAEHTFCCLLGIAVEGGITVVDRQRERPCKAALSADLIALRLAQDRQQQCHPQQQWPNTSDMWNHSSCSYPSQRYSTSPPCSICTSYSGTSSPVSTNRMRRNHRIQPSNPPPM